jgi:hypothetical protein
MGFAGLNVHWAQHTRVNTSINNKTLILHKSKIGNKAATTRKKFKTLQPNKNQENQLQPRTIIQ